MKQISLIKKVQPTLSTPFTRLYLPLRASRLYQVDKIRFVSAPHCAEIQVC